MKNYWLAAFVAIAGLNVLGVVLGEEMLIRATKPLMMPMLAGWVWQSAPVKNPQLRMGWLAGLFFSTLGDILLMFPGSMYFLLGLSAFLLAHVGYIYAINTGLRAQRGFLLQNKAWIIPLALYPVLLLFWLWDGIPAGMRAPVAVYAGVISTMAASVINLRGYIPAPVFNSMFAGAVLFVLSDSLIAVSKFGHPFEGSHLSIIVTYIIGQYLLAKGVRQQISG